MKLFALETDVGKIKERFCHEGERVVFMTYYHGLSFLFAILREIFITVALIGVAITAWYFEAPMLWTSLILGTLWFGFVFFNVLKSWIDWYYDFILVTSDKVILVDQTAIFRQEIKPIHIENIGSVGTDTQFWGIFPFGIIRINLKEGLGGENMTLKYVPRAKEIAGKISEVVTYYQRFVDGSGNEEPQTQRDVARTTRAARRPASRVTPVG